MGMMVFSRFYWGTSGKEKFPRSTFPPGTNSPAAQRSGEEEGKRHLHLFPPPAKSPGLGRWQRAGPGPARPVPSRPQPPVPPAQGRPGSAHPGSAHPGSARPVPPRPKAPPGSAATCARPGRGGAAPSAGSLPCRCRTGRDGTGSGSAAGPGAGRARPGPARPGEAAAPPSGAEPRAARPGGQRSRAWTSSTGWRCRPGRSSGTGWSAPGASGSAAAGASGARGVGSAEARGSWRSFRAKRSFSRLYPVARALQGVRKVNTGLEWITQISKQNVCRLHLQRKEEYFQSVCFQSCKEIVCDSLWCMSLMQIRKA